MNENKKEVFVNKVVVEEANEEINKFLNLAFEFTELKHTANLNDKFLVSVFKNSYCIKVEVRDLIRRREYKITIVDNIVTDFYVRRIKRDEAQKIRFYKDKLKKFEYDKDYLILKVNYSKFFFVDFARRAEEEKKIKERVRELAKRREQLIKKINENSESILLFEEEIETSYCKDIDTKCRYIKELEEKNAILKKELEEINKELRRIEAIWGIEYWRI
jgi:hypothetical protein